jgi:hypothetical protein
LQQVKSSSLQAERKRGLDVELGDGYMPVAANRRGHVCGIDDRGSGGTRLNTDSKVNDIITKFQTINGTKSIGNCDEV